MAPRVRSPLQVTFAVSRRAVELAGGIADLHDRFTSRLKAFLYDSGTAFEVGFTPTQVWASETTAQKRLLIFACYAERLWDVDEREISYTLEAFDLARFIAPVPGLDCIEGTTDPLWCLLRAARNLVADWPEVIAASELQEP